MLVTRGLGGVSGLLPSAGMGSFSLIPPVDSDKFRVSGSGIHQFYQFVSISSPAEWHIRQKTLEG